MAVLRRRAQPRLRLSRADLHLPERVLRYSVSGTIHRLPWLLTSPESAGAPLGGRINPAGDQLKVPEEYSEIGASVRDGPSQRAYGRIPNSCCKNALVLMLGSAPLDRESASDFLLKQAGPLGDIS